MAHIVDFTHKAVPISDFDVDFLVWVWLCKDDGGEENKLSTCNMLVIHAIRAIASESNFDVIFRYEGKDIKFDKNMRSDDWWDLPNTDLMFDYLMRIL